jgi:hypothetical protein
MDKLQKRKHLIRKLFKEVAKETVGPENLRKVKLIILSKIGRGSSYCRCRHRYIWNDSQQGQVTSITIGLNLRGLEDRIRNGYGSSYYEGRPERLNKYIIKNRHNALRFILYHEARHAWQRLNKRNRANLIEKERDADSWALAHLLTRPQKLQTRKPDQTFTRPEPKVEEYIKLYTSGISTARIAVLCKVKDPRSIRYYLKKAGIILRRNNG